MAKKNNIFIGIDVSKATLDISLSGKHTKIANKKDAIRFFIKQEIVAKKIDPTLVCLESTGGYERIAFQAFQDAKIPIYIAHPNKVHSFAKASGHFAKTDKLDAKLLEKYAEFVSPKEKGDKNISETTYELKALRDVERDLMDALHATKCRIKTSFGKAIGYLKKQEVFIQKQLKTVRENIKKIITSDEQLNEKYERLQSCIGVAQITASTFIAELPELGMLNKKEIASLIGVAPKTHESGIKKLNGRIMGGRFYARKALYMVGLVAIRYDKKMKAFYERLVAAGKAKKVAIVAVMRKIIVCLNAMLKNNQPYFKGEVG